MAVLAYILAIGRHARCLAMKAIHIETLPTHRCVGRKRPLMLGGEVRIRVVATAVNRADLMQRNGLYPPRRVHLPFWALGGWHYR